MGHMSSLRRPRGDTAMTEESVTISCGLRCSSYGLSSAAAARGRGEMGIVAELHRAFARGRRRARISLQHSRVATSPENSARVYSREQIQSAFFMRRRNRELTYTHTHTQCMHTATVIPPGLLQRQTCTFAPGSHRKAPHKNAEKVEPQWSACFRTSDFGRGKEAASQYLRTTKSLSDRQRPVLRWWRGVRRFLARARAKMTPKVLASVQV